MQVIKGPGKHLRQPVPAVGSGGSCYRWAERHEIFKAADQVPLDKASGFPFAHFLGLLMLAGMRVEEARRMRWEPPSSDRERWPWPDMKSWQIEIPDSRASLGRRCVPIIPQLARMLTYWPCAKRGSLFPFPVDDDQLADCWHQTLRLAGVKRLGIPALRKSYALMMQDVFGLSPTAIANILGWPRRPVTRVRSVPARRVRRVTA